MGCCLHVDFLGPPLQTTTVLTIMRKSSCSARTFLLWTIVYSKDVPPLNPPYWSFFLPSFPFLAGLDAARSLVQPAGPPFAQPSSTRCVENLTVFQCLHPWNQYVKQQLSATLFSVRIHGISTSSSNTVPLLLPLQPAKMPFQVLRAVPFSDTSLLEHFGQC